MSKKYELSNTPFLEDTSKNYRGWSMDNEKLKYICDDRPVSVCSEVDNMTDHEAELEFQKRFAGVCEQS